MRPSSIIKQLLTSTALLMAVAAFLVAQAPKSTQTPQPTQNPQAAKGTTPTAEQFVKSAVESGYNEIMLAQLAQQRSMNDDVKDYAEQLEEDHGEINEKLTEIAKEKGFSLPEFHDETDNVRSSVSKAGQDVSQAGKQAGEATRQAGEAVAQAGKDTADTVRGTPQSQQGQQQGKSAETGAAERAAPGSMEARVAALRNASGAAFDRQYIALMVESHEKAVRDFEQYARNGQDSDLREFADDTVDTLRGHLDKARDLNDELSNSK